MTPAEKKRMASLVDRLIYLNRQLSRTLQEIHDVEGKFKAAGVGVYRGNIGNAELDSNGKVSVHEK